MTTRMETLNLRNAQNLLRRLQLAVRTPRRPPAPQSPQRAPQQAQHEQSQANLDLCLRPHLPKMSRQRQPKRSLEGSSRQVQGAMLYRRLRAGRNELSKKSDRRRHKKQRLQNRVRITIAHQVLDFDRSL